MNLPTGSSASDAPPAAEAHASAQPTTGLDLENLISGGRWRGAYAIGEQMPDITHGRSFKALHVSLMNDVVIRSFRVSNGMRALTWERMGKSKNTALVELIEAVEDDGRRVEVIQAPPTVTLREWAGRRKASQAEIELIVRQLSEALGSLHKQDVVHLNLRADTIFVRATEGGLSVLLGGFETASLLRAEGPVEVSMDPFYAPPEAVGLYHYTREPALRAWDWWSLGRVIQEVALGRHILAHILERDVTRETPELRVRAENLLKESDPTSKAGAVEMMPAMDRDLASLLRGLLTGSRDGRWGLTEVESWLRKEPVKDRYNLPRNERLFIWKDRAYTVAEAAEYFASAENWQEGVLNLFEPGNPSTLAYFIGTEGAHKKTKERFDVLIKLGEAPALQELPVEIVSSVVMAVVLKFLAGHAVPLRLRGHRIDEKCLRLLLRSEAQPAGLKTVQAFTARSIVQQVEQFDAEVGRMLGSLDHIYQEALALALQNNWLLESDEVEKAVLMELCLESEIALSSGRAEMAKLYACTRDRALDKLFKKPTPNYAELAVIAFSACDPIKFGYVSHQDWNAEQYRLLSERGRQLADAALWLQLGHALKFGPLVFGRLRLLLPVWCLLAAAVAVVGQNRLAYALALLCPLAVLGVRIVYCRRHRAKVQHRLHPERPWALRSGWTHCRVEALSVLKADSAPGPRALLRLLKETNEEIAKLTLTSVPRPISLPVGFRDTQLVALASWFVLLVIGGSSVWYGVHHPPKLPTIKWSQISSLWSSGEENGNDAAKTEKSAVKVSVAHIPATSMKSIQNKLEAMRRAKREAEKEPAAEIKVSWPFKTPTTALVVRIHESAPALPEQMEVAQEMAQLQVDRYDPVTINADIAVQVPVVKGVGIMLVEGRTGKIADRKVYTIGYVPFARTWLEVDSKKAIFLGER